MVVLTQMRLTFSIQWNGHFPIWGPEKSKVQQKRHLCSESKARLDFRWSLLHVSARNVLNKENLTKALIKERVNLSYSAKHPGTGHLECVWGFVNAIKEFSSGFILFFLHQHLLCVDLYPCLLLQYFSSMPCL